MKRPVSERSRKANQSLKHLLWQERLRAGLSREETAAKLGVTTSVMASVEENPVRAPLFILARLFVLYRSDEFQIENRLGFYLDRP